MDIKGYIRLRPNKTRSIDRFHPWVFSGAVASTDGDPQDGDFVAVTDLRGGILGYGFYTAAASITVRMTHFGAKAPDAKWIRKRLEQAHALRNALGLVNNASTSIYRLVHGEGDNLPGLIIDFYGGVIVFQAHSISMWRHREEITEALKAIYGDDLKAVYDKSAETLHINEEETSFHLFGDVPDELVALENDLKFRIDWDGGQKTGFFIDQRENRAMVGRMSKGKKVLNAFSYTAGFSAYALRAGADLVHSVDSSERALELGDENISNNELDTDRHESIQADVKDFLKNPEINYDAIILDPPSFAKHPRSRHKAVQAYKRLNKLAIRNLTEGGLLFTYSCSQAVDKNVFNNTVVAAAIEAGRNVRVLYQVHQPADHPINIFHPEGEYLKGLVLEVG